MHRLLLACAAGGVYLQSDRGQLRRGVEQREKAAQRAFARRPIESQEHERKRIATGLHDSLGHVKYPFQILAEFAPLLVSLAGGAGAALYWDATQDMSFGSASH